MRLLPQLQGTVMVNGWEVTFKFILPFLELNWGQPPFLTIYLGWCINHKLQYINYIFVLGPNRRFKRVLELIQIQLQAHLYEPQSKPEGRYRRS